VVRGRQLLGRKRTGTRSRGCHGDDEQVVFEKLCQIVEEAIALYEKDRKPRPPPTYQTAARGR